MRQNIKIAVQTTNRYLYLGLTDLLQTSFNNRQWRVTFLPEQQSVRADLIIQSDAEYCAQQCDKQTAGIVRQQINQRHNRGTCYRHRQARVCLCKQVVISYQQRSPDLQQQVDSWLASLGSAIFPTINRPQHMMSLTTREHEILSIMQRELTPSEIAADLGINIKTVSHHKRNAMQKLGFTRNSELYHWLRQGGLLFNNRALM